MSRVDRESFQKFLGNAFAVQESGLDPQTLAAFVELQQFIDSDEFDMDRAIRMIADCALRVSNAAGVAIAQMVGEELIYRAGIGSAAENVGHRIPAVLAGSSPERPRREILRVENATSDRRVESEICRQFGAVALIMLPIHHNRGLAGVLQVLFNEAHSFHEREVRAYQLLVGALEDGIARLEGTSEPRTVQERPPVVAKISGMPQAPCPVGAKPRDPVVADRARLAVARRWQLVSAKLGTSIERGGRVCRHARQRVTGMLRVLEHRIRHAARTNVGRFPEINLNRSIDSAVEGWRYFRSRVRGGVSVIGDWLRRATVIDVSRLWFTGLRASEAAILGLVLLMTAVWVVNRSHSPSSSSRVTESATTQSQAPAAAKPPMVVRQTQPQPEQRERKAFSKESLKRVRVGSDEVDYIGDDVTIRRFASLPAKHRVGKNVKEKNFGDDVTVRYFADAPELGSPASTSISKPTAAARGSQSR